MSSYKRKYLFAICAGHGAVFSFVTMLLRTFALQSSIYVSDTRKHIWQIVYHFKAFFELNLGVILSFALIKPAACINKIKNSFKLEVVFS